MRKLSIGVFSTVQNIRRLESQNLYDKQGVVLCHAVSHFVYLIRALECFKGGGALLKNVLF